MITLTAMMWQGGLKRLSHSSGSLQFQYAYDAASNETDRYAYLPNSMTIRQQVLRAGQPEQDVQPAGQKEGCNLFDRGLHLRSHESHHRAEPRRFGRLLWLLLGRRADVGHLRRRAAFCVYRRTKSRTWTPPTTLIPTPAISRRRQEGPEPTPPPDDSSDPPVGGFDPAGFTDWTFGGYYFDKAGNRQQVTDTADSHSIS